MEAWMNQSWWLYDLTVLALLILCVWSGWRRGVIQMVVGLLGYGLAMVLAGICAQPAAEYVYDRWIADTCTTMLEQKMDDYHLADTVQQVFSTYGIQLDAAQLQEIAADSDGAADQLYAAASEKTGIPVDLLQQNVSQSVNQTISQTYTDLPGWMTDALSPSTTESSQQNNRIAQTVALLLSGDNASAAKNLTTQYIRPVVIQLVKIFMFSVFFLLISAVLQVIIRLVSYMRHADGAYLTDRTIGAAIGLAQAVLFLVLMTKLTVWIVAHGDGQIAFFNEAVIAKTKLFYGLYQMLS